MSKSWINYNKQNILVDEMISTWYWLSCTLHAISTQGNSYKVKTIQCRIQAWAFNHYNCWSSILILAKGRPCLPWVAKYGNFAQWSIQWSTHYKINKNICVVINCLTSFANNEFWDFIGTRSMFFIGPL